MSKKGKRIVERVGATLGTALSGVSVTGMRVVVAERDYGAALVKTRHAHILFERGTDEDEGTLAVTVTFKGDADTSRTVRNALMRKYGYKPVKRGGPIRSHIYSSHEGAKREAKMILRHFKARNEGIEYLDQLLSEGVELPEAHPLPAYPWR